MNVYVPALRPEIVFVLPEPDIVLPPGNVLMIQLPVAGKLLSTTLPVGTSNVG